jgi:hypothetical protein
MAAWAVILAAAATFLWTRRSALPQLVLPPAETAIAAAIAAIACVIGVTAIVSPPNSADAMAYHMPRVVYWAQSGSIAFFPTPYFNQITLPPLAEYFMLHTYVISGSDRFINLVAFFAFLGSVAGVSWLAAAMGLKGKGQAMAALFCATLPAGTLQASGAKNDWLVTFWLVCLAGFLLRRETLFAALALGLAVTTKSTAYLFAPPLILALCLWLHPRLRPREAARFAASLALGVLLVNAPQYLRNFQLSGSPLGYDSAQGDGFFRWRNEHPGWKSTVSNALRHLSEQLGGRNSRWNEAVCDAVLRVHASLGLDPQDPDTTWRWSRYDPPRNANHEANANNRWHLLLLAIAAAVGAFPRRRRWLLYAAGLAIAFLLFCFYLKWQPFLGRLELPLFVLAAPLAGMLLESLIESRRWAWLAIVVCLFLAANTRLALLENWTRPLRGPHSLWTEAREEAYFNDMGQWNNRASYLEAVDRTARARCDIVGLDISENQLEYPFQALLLRQRPSVRFVHTGVENASARYYPPQPPRPCAVLCLDCIGNRKKLALYTPLGEPLTIGRFLLFLAPAAGQ